MCSFDASSQKSPSGPVRNFQRSYNSQVTGAVPFQLSSPLAVNAGTRQATYSVFGEVVEVPCGRASGESWRRDDATDLLSADLLHVRPPRRLAEHVVLLRHQTERHASVGTQHDVACGELTNDEHEPGTQFGAGELRGV